MQTKLLAEILCIFECLLTQNPTNQGSKLSKFFQILWKLLENPNTGASMELFLPENNFKASSTVNFPKNVQILKTWKQTKDMNLKLDFYHIPFCI